MQRLQKIFIGLVLFLVVMLAIVYHPLAFPHLLNKFSTFRSFGKFSLTRTQTRHNISGSSSTAVSNTSLQKQTFLQSKPETNIAQSLERDQKAQNTTKLAARSKKLICMTFTGRLGNQLFQYASVIGLSRKLDRIPVYDDSPILRPALQHPPPPASQEHKQRCKIAQTQSEKTCCYFQKVFLELDPDKDYKVGQYLQSYKYFEGSEEEVRKAMQFKDSSRLKADKVIQELRKTWNRTLIGVHVRRGDYLKVHLIRKGYVTAPAAYFQRAMAYMRTRLGNVVFAVSVDNEKWFRDLAGKAKDVVILKRQDAQTDMALLSSLDHVITSVGTYSWWIGYLNRGVVVYWKDFIKPGTFIGSTFNPDGSTFIYPSWIPL